MQHDKPSSGHLVSVERMTNRTGRLLALERCARAVQNIFQWLSLFGWSSATAAAGGVVVLHKKMKLLKYIDFSPIHGLNLDLQM